MSIQTAIFAVQRGGTQYGVAGADIGDKLVSGDVLVLSRDGTSQQFVYAGGVNEILDTDLFACTDDDKVTKTVTGAQFKELFGPPPPPPKPWEGACGIFHVILNNPADIKVSNHTAIYNLDTEQEVSSITAAGEWIVIGDGTRFKDSYGNWDFGELTDTGCVSTMDQMFLNTREFNSDISNWDVSNVKVMSSMFDRAQAFNSDISNWDVGNVLDMRDMFSIAPVFNSDISNWDTSNVTNMRNMFNNASQFNQNISNWDVGNVMNMWGLFNNASQFNQDVNTKQVTVDGNTYTAWDVRNVWDMRFMFQNIHAFNSDLSNWNTSRASRMDNMFYRARGFNTDISSWDTSNVANMNNMFNNATSFNQDLSQWCVSKFFRRPPGFDINAAAWTQPRPVWGTCPRGENQA